jgi:hypothetical protein
MFLGLKLNKIKFQTFRSLLSPTDLKKPNFQKLKKKLGLQRIEPTTFCIRAQAATVALISHFKILTYEK